MGKHAALSEPNLQLKSGGAPAPLFFNLRRPSFGVELHRAARAALLTFLTYDGAIG